MATYGFTQAEICWGDAYENEDAVRGILQRMKDLGATYVRMSAAQAGTWADLDRAVNLVHEYGMKPLLCVFLFPSTAWGGDGSSATGFGNVCHAMALRYGPAGSGLVDVFELGNEPNSGANFSQNAGAYVPWLKAGYPAIKSVHPGSTVLAAGTIPAPTEWFGFATDPVQWYTDIYNHGGQAYFDAVAMHVYSDPTGIPTADTRQLKYVTDVVSLMAAQGDSAKLIWVTEVGEGAPQTTTYTLQRDQTKAMVDFINTFGAKMGPYFIYSLRDADNDFGIYDINFNAKHPYLEYIQTLAGSVTSTDTTPPSAPTMLTYSNVTQNSVSFSWGPSSDNVAVNNYRLYVAAAKVAEPTATSTTYDQFTPGTPYSAYVTAVDTSGLESPPSNTVTFTTAAPSGLSATFAYDWTANPSVVPSVFTTLSNPLVVSGGIALPAVPSGDFDRYDMYPYWLDQQTPDHSCEIAQAIASQYVDRYTIAAIRSKPDGTQWIGALIASGVPSGTVDACKIIMYNSGVITVLKTCNATPLMPGEKLRFGAEGKVYTVSRININGSVSVLLPWTDQHNTYTGVANRRVAIGYRHKTVRGIHYPPPGITGLFKAIDLNPVQPSAGFEPWMFAVTDPHKWPLLLATNQFELALL